MSEWIEREEVRGRPSMYIYDTRERGLDALARAVISPSFWESKSGSVTLVDVSLNRDGTITVADDGSGMPVEIDAELSHQLGRDVTTLEAVMTTYLSLPSKVADASPRWEGCQLSFWVVELCVVNMLAEWFEATVTHQGKTYQQSYRTGLPEGPVDALGGINERGFRTTFRPDGEILQVTDFNPDHLRAWLKQMAFLNPGVRVRFADEMRQQRDEWCEDRGISAYVEALQVGRHPVHEGVIRTTGEVENIRFDVAFQYADESQEVVRSYVNDQASFGYPVDATDGGTHVRGFRLALRDSLNRFRSNGKVDGVSDLAAVQPVDADFRDGLTAVLSITYRQAQWTNSMRSQLANVEVQHALQKVLGEFLDRYWESHPETAHEIIKTIIHAARRWRRIEGYRGLCEFYLTDDQTFDGAEDDVHLICMPDSYAIRMYHSNGGRILSPIGEWELFPIAKDTDDSGVPPPAEHVLQQTYAARRLSGFPERGVVVGRNDAGDLLVFLPSEGEDWWRYGAIAYAWNSRTGEIYQVVDDLAVCQPLYP